MAAPESDCFKAPEGFLPSCGGRYRCFAQRARLKAQPLGTNAEVLWTGGSLESVVLLGGAYVGPTAGWVHKSLQRRQRTFNYGPSTWRISSPKKTDDVEVVARPRVGKFGPAEWARSVPQSFSDAGHAPTSKSEELAASIKALKSEDVLPEVPERGASTSFATAASRQLGRFSVKLDGVSEVRPSVSTATALDPGLRFEAPGDMELRVQSSFHAPEDSQATPSRSSIVAHACRPRGRVARLAAQLLERKRMAQLKEHYERISATLDEEEVQAVSSIFNRVGTDEYAILDPEVLRACIVELGLGVTSAKDRREVYEVCDDVLRIEGNAESQQQSEISMKILPERSLTAPTSMIRRRSSGRLRGAKGVIYDVALRKLPQLRQARHASCCQELRKFADCVTGFDASVDFPVDIWAQVAWRLGVDPRFFTKVTESLAEEHGNKSKNWRGSPPSPLAIVGVVLRGSTKGLEMGTVRKLPLEVAARAIVRCREGLERTRRARERAIQDEACIGEAAFLEMRSVVIDLYERFSEYCMTGSSCITTQAAISMLMEFGMIRMPSSSSASSNGHRASILGKVHEQEVALLEEANGGYLGFEAIIRFCVVSRDKRRAEWAGLQAFVDNNMHKDHFTMKEASHLLGYLEMAPRTRNEQKEIELMFVELTGSSRDRSAIGNIWLITAYELGLTEEELHELWRAFVDADMDNTGWLNANQLKDVLATMKRHPAHEGLIDVLENVLSAENEGWGSSGANQRDEDNILVDFVDCLRVYAQIPMDEEDSEACPTPDAHPEGVPASVPSGRNRAGLDRVFRGRHARGDRRANDSTGIQARY